MTHGKLIYLHAILAKLWLIKVQSTFRFQIISPKSNNAIIEVPRDVFCKLCTKLVGSRADERASFAPSYNTIIAYYTS